MKHCRCTANMPKINNKKKLSPPEIYIEKVCLYRFPWEHEPSLQTDHVNCKPMGGHFELKLERCNKHAPKLNYSRHFFESLLHYLV